MLGKQTRGEMEQERRRRRRKEGESGKVKGREIKVMPRVGGFRWRYEKHNSGDEGTCRLLKTEHGGGQRKVSRAQPEQGNLDF